jgi:hypothetical protein
MIQLKRKRPNLNVIISKRYTLWFSYETIISFYDSKLCKSFTSENVWSNTTGKHLNFIEPDHKKRIPNSEFVKLLEKLKI